MMGFNSSEWKQEMKEENRFWQFIGDNLGFIVIGTIILISFVFLVSMVFMVNWHYNGS